MLRRLLISLLVVGAFATGASANQKLYGYCLQQGSTTSSLGCTVTVFQTGTTILATIYQDNLNTPLANPFTVANNTSLWAFYAPNGRYDVNLSGGASPISPAYTLSDILFNDPSLNTGVVLLSPPGAQTISGFSLTLASSAPLIVNSAATFTGSLSTQSLTCKNFENVLCAAQFSGVDWVAKVNSADLTLGSLAGEIWLDQSAGLTATTALSLSAKHVLRFIQGGIYGTSNTVTLAQGASLWGPPQGVNDGTNSGPATIQQVSGSNLANFIIVNGSQAAIYGVNIDANKAGNASGGNGLAINAPRFVMQDGSVKNAQTNGVSVNSTVSANNEAAAPTFLNVMIIGNGQSGIVCNNTTDGIVDGNTQSENNGKDGYELHNCSGWRFSSADGGGNTRYGLSSDGRSDFWGGTGLMIGGVMQFGFNGQGDIYIQGLCTNATALCAQWNKISYYANGLPSTAADATYDSLHIENGVGNVIGPISIRSISGHRYKYGVHLLDSGGEASTENILGLYECNDAGASGACIQDDSAATGLTQQLWHPYLINNVPLRWLDAGGTPRNIIDLGGDNNVYLTGHPTQQTINIQPVPGTTSFQATATKNSGLNIPILTTLTTASGADNVTVTGMTSSGHCTIQATNAGAAAMTGVYVSAKTTNQITVTHSGTTGGTFDIWCTSN